ncbi:MAG: alpha/beta hydrolase [Eubacteriales bacterium]|nr:alpha/beta hydrolase [Eubacteriales bacterium]
MLIKKERLSEHAEITGYIHERNRELGEEMTYPTMLVLPGGGFRFCSAREGEPIAAAYYAKGYNTFVLDYTTVSKKPDAGIEDPMQDVQLALAWLKEHEEEFHGTPHNTAMIGFSGGGHLAAASATHDELRPNALLLIYPGILSNPARALDCPDIIERVDEQTPASFIIGSREDTVTPPRHQLAFAAALEKAEVDFELHIFPDGFHGMSLGTEVTASGNKTNIDPVYASWFDMSVRWLARKWKGIDSNGKSVANYTVDMPLSKLMKNEHVAVILKEKIPAFDQILQNSMARTVPFNVIAQFEPDLLTPEMVEEISILLQTV